MTDSSSAEIPVASNWASYMRSIYFQRKPPITGSFNADTLEGIAREKLKDAQGSFNFIFGTAGTGSTYEANRQEFNKWRIVPRMLRGVTSPSLQTTLFGVTYTSPILLAPIGVQCLVDPEGECSSAAAAARLGIPFVMSSASSRSIEAVANASAMGPRWFQLYWPKTPNVLRSVISRLKANGFSALVITVDSTVLGWRPLDLDTAFLPFAHGVGTQVGLTDPEFMAMLGLEPYPVDDKPSFPYNPAITQHAIETDDTDAKQRSDVGLRYISEMLSSGIGRSWNDLKEIKALWDGPLIIKGITCLEDAELAIDYGIDGIVVSNHGGRQIDGAVSSLYALQQVMSSQKVRDAQARGSFTVLFDSGVRTGSDVLKAIALGAQAILYGRAYIYALAVAGQAGVETHMRAVHADLEITLGLSGHSSLDDFKTHAQKAVIHT